MNTLPRLRRSADRCYTLLSTPDELRTMFRAFGFRHYASKPGDLWSDRWTHDSPQGRTVLVLVPSGRLSLLGPIVGSVDALAAGSEAMR